MGGLVQFAFATHLFDANGIAIAGTAILQTDLRFGDVIGLITTTLLSTTDESLASNRTKRKEVAIFPVGFDDGERNGSLKTSEIPLRSN